MSKGFRYIYGPVPSWRVGSSLGVDLLSQREKICSFDCIYCQLGTTDIYTTERRVYVPEDLILKEIEMLPKDLHIDYITLSGRGEPTLAKNLGSTIRALKAIRREGIAVITNSTLINIWDVQEELSHADFVIAKLDACSEESLMAVNKPTSGIRFDAIVQGLKDFRTHFMGKLALQVMFIKENQHCAQEIGDMAREINPQEIQINTPLRPCGVDPLMAEELSKLKDFFAGLNTITVYESHKKDVKPISEADTLKRRGKI
ncbi:MAG TPA: radical SAM protein [Syntrophorhabdaceae bacterium]|nr:radical SAM protein [Syntrophorhabdaceae bacterium]HOL05204.1 radical SAM protein [Syntrophorhabdaceae bacterium]HPC66310.1 radical SAM protein [Syntrophorhabdaceae bacterium]HPP41382.1 radical SAM protein [Syntrophorhabdaceae bacterium]HQE81057.1 radical SAM protein [Syntrophorhabdaceae bacterium]